MPVDYANPVVVGAGAGFLALLGALAYWLIAFRPMHVAAAFLVRVKPEHLANHPRRRAALDLLADATPRSTREVATATRSNYGTMAYHLHHLQHGRLVASIAHGRNRIWFRPGHRPTAARLAVAKDAGLRETLDQVAANPGQSPSQVARSLGQAKSSVHRRVARLAGLGLVRVERTPLALRCYIERKG